MVDRRETKKTVIGKQIIHNKGVITIKECKGVNGTVNEFIAECNVCSLDKNLWPYGSLSYNMINIKREEVLCGCSRVGFQHTWQLELTIKRMLNGGDLIFKGWESGEYLDNSSKMVLLNSEGIEWRVSIGNLRKQSIPVFSKEYRAKKKIQHNIKHLEYSPLLPDHYTYSYNTLSKKYEVSCSVCNSDTKFLSLGDKVFPSRLSQLKSGSKPCRCSPTYAYSKDEWVLRILSEFTDREIDPPPLPEKLNSRSTLDWICKIGHECSTKVGALVQGVGCPECSELGGSTYGYYKLRLQEEDSLYLIKFTSPNCKEVFYKIGRSFNVKSRMAHMKTYYDLELISTYKGKHYQIYDLEQKLHSLIRSNKHFVSNYFNGCIEECFTPEILSHPDVIKTFNLKTP